MDRYDEMTDEVLVAAYRAGDFAAMEHLCKKYQKVVSAYGKKFFIKGSEEQDVVQEGMVGLFKAIQDYDPQTQVNFSQFAGSASAGRSIRRSRRRIARRTSRSIPMCRSLIRRTRRAQTGRSSRISWRMMCRIRKMYGSMRKRQS